MCKETVPCSAPDENLLLDTPLIDIADEYGGVLVEYCQRGESDEWFLTFKFKSKSKRHKARRAFKQYLDWVDGYDAGYEEAKNEN